MSRIVPLFALLGCLGLAFVACHTTDPLPELALDGGPDAGPQGALRIDTTQLQDGIPRVPYLEQVQVVGGTQPYRYTLSKPDALSWLDVVGRGELVGTPTQVATGSITVTVHDALDAGAEVTLPLAVVGCQEGAQYPCEVSNAGACELGVASCNAGALGNCGALSPSDSVFGCGEGCGACDPTRADHCEDGGSCACGTTGAECSDGGSCCPGQNCVDLANDPRNCKSCGNDCVAKAPPHMDAGCGGLDCQFGCSPGYSDCDGGIANGCETNVWNGDPKNCGACGNACVDNHNAPTCASGSCGLGSCDPDYKDCDRDAGDGCEINAQNGDVNNCGDCGIRCSWNHDVPKCVSGSCQVACIGTYKDCDQKVDSGCETDTSNSAGNCGTCGHVCPGPTSGSGSGVCVSSTCGIQCAAGLTACGTECVDLTSDRTNCGACGRVCGGTAPSCTDTACCNTHCVGGNCSRTCIYPDGGVFSL